MKSKQSKRALSLAMAMTMASSLAVPALAGDEENKEYSTNVSYDAVEENGTTEEYIVVVPASMKPGETDEVTATGTWASNRKLTVTSPENVTLTNDLDKGTKTLSVTFQGIEQVGNNVESINVSEDIAVGEISNAIFGTWSGVIKYNVALGDHANFSLSESTLTMEKGGTHTLTVSFAEDASVREVTWASSAPEVVSVEGGVLTANATGEATITATVGGMKVTCSVTVNEGE